MFNLGLASRKYYVAFIASNCINWETFSMAKIFELLEFMLLFSSTSFTLL